MSDYDTDQEDNFLRKRAEDRFEWGVDDSSSSEDDEQAIAASSTTEQRPPSDEEDIDSLGIDDVYFVDSDEEGDFEHEPGFKEAQQIEKVRCGDRINTESRDPWDLAAWYALSEIKSYGISNYFSEGKKTAACWFITKTIPKDHLIRMNIPPLVAAILITLINDKKPLNAKNVRTFIEKANGLENINHLDFIRYIRMIRKYV